MGFGVKEPKTHVREHVPGTTTIYGDERENVEIVPQANLKRGHGSNSKVILVPQPSDSPNDPLVNVP